MKGIPVLDFRRAFSRRWAVGLWPRLFEFVFQPVFVAAVVCLAFLAKEKENTIPAFANAFFYFTGLYAFWVGLFGACQSLNGEVQNGEWSYWTLGLRRFIPTHVMSIFSVNLACALWNVALFSITVVAISSLCLGKEAGFNPFVSCFLTQNPSHADPLWQCGFMLKPLLVAKFGAFGPLLFATCLYALSLFAAAVCGVCFGMLLSVLFPDPSVSLNASVAFVVLLGMISLLGLQGDKSRNSGKENRSLDLCFASRFEFERADNHSSGSKAMDSLVALSRILPQRYFFNVARMPIEKHIDKSVSEAIRNELCMMASIPTDETEVWWEKDEPSYTNNGRGAWGLDASAEPGNLIALAAEISEFRDNNTGMTFSEKYRIALWRRLFLKSIFHEMVPLIWMCLFCLFIVNVGVLTFPAYRQLR
jgi:hypothetical protein